MKPYFIDAWRLESGNPYLSSFVEELRDIVLDSPSELVALQAIEDAFDDALEQAEAGFLSKKTVDRLRSVMAPVDGNALLIGDDLDRYTSDAIYPALRTCRYFQVEGFNILYPAYYRRLVEILGEALDCKEATAVAYLQKIVTNWFKAPVTPMEDAGE